MTKEMIIDPLKGGKVQHTDQPIYKSQERQASWEGWGNLANVNQTKKINGQNLTKSH